MAKFDGNSRVTFQVERHDSSAEGKSPSIQSNEGILF